MLLGVVQPVPCLPRRDNALELISLDPYNIAKVSVPPDTYAFAPDFLSAHPEEKESFVLRAGIGITHVSSSIIVPYGS